MADFEAIKSRFSWLDGDNAAYFPADWSQITNIQDYIDAYESMVLSRSETKAVAAATRNLVDFLGKNVAAYDWGILCDMLDMGCKPAKQPGISAIGIKIASRRPSTLTHEAVYKILGLAKQ